MELRRYCIPSIQGPTGPRGAMGLQGFQGPMKVTPQGATGPVGLQGIQGSTGPSGPSGITGGTGATGLAGQVGLLGPSGTPGTAGIAGVSGPTGTIGPTGIQGPVAYSPPGSYQFLPGATEIVTVTPTYTTIATVVTPSSPLFPSPSGWVFTINFQGDSTGNGQTTYTLFRGATPVNSWTVDIDGSTPPSYTSYYWDSSPPGTTYTLQMNKSAALSGNFTAAFNTFFDVLPLT